MKYTQDLEQGGGAASPSYNGRRLTQPIIIPWRTVCTTEHTRGIYAEKD